MQADLFIANVPEIAKENDFFSLNYLQSRGGLMPFRWFNLYGIPTAERNPNIIDYIFKRNKLIEGTEYFGRILLSLSLNSHDKPIKGLQQLNAFREPPSINYILRVDTYELQGAKDCGSFVFLKVGIGSYSCKSELAYQKKDYEQSKLQQKKVYISDAYEWKENKIMLPETKCDLPQDKTQIPDVLISLYTNSKFSKDHKRVAYLRIPVTNTDINSNKPKWYALKSISNNLDPSVHSYLLLNISLRMNIGNQDIPRIPIRRNIKASFLFAAYFYAGYDLDPESNSDDIESVIKVRIAHYQKEVSNRKIGRNPIWNEVLLQMVELDENLEFASNIIVTIENPKKKMLGLVNLYTGTIGEICVSALNCKTNKDPSLSSEFAPSFQFYHIMKDGQSQGRILAAFHLYKNEKKRHQIGKEEFRRAVDFSSNMIKSNLNIAFVGVRNLPSPVQTCQLRIKIAIDPPLERTQNLNDDQLKNNSFIEAFISSKSAELQPGTSSKLGTSNPNFLQIFRKEVEIPRDWRFFPLLEIEFISDGYFKKSIYRTEIPIFEVVDWLNSTEKSAAKAFYENGKKVPLINGDENDDYIDNLMAEIMEKDIKITINEERVDSKRKLLDEKQENEDKNIDKNGKATEKNDIEQNDLENIKGKKKLDTSYDDENDLFIRNDKFFNAKLEDVIEFIASKEDKLIEDKNRKERIDQLKQEIYNLPSDKYQEALKTKKIQEILNLKNSKMNEEKFKVQDDKSNKHHLQIN